jgi:hypothetical protein
MKIMKIKSKIITAILPLLLGFSLSAQDIIEIDICLGAKVTFTATAIDAGIAPTYQWKKNNLQIEDATDSIYSYTPENGDVIFCEVTSTEECSSPRTVFSSTVVIHVSNQNCGVTSVVGTVFPFIRWNHEAIDTLFNVTVNLKSIPNPESEDPFGDIMNETPLYSTEAVYYDGSVFVPNSPKYAGMVGALNNYGLPINWKDAIGVEGGTPNTTILVEDEKPVTQNGATLGLYVIENVAPGYYILEIKREGFVTRWAKIKVDADEPVFHLEHREIVAGDVDSTLLINQLDAAEMQLNIGGDFLIPSTNYNFKFDLNADGKVNLLDYNLILKFNGFWFYHYAETMEWIEELGIDINKTMNNSNTTINNNKIKKNNKKNR